MSKFDVVMDEDVLPAEGGYVNDLRDPGGETKFGISKRTYPNLNISGLTLDDAKRIYKRDFWDVLQLDGAPLSIARHLMDAAVNSGVQGAIRMLQRAVGVADDGHVGPVTQAAIAKMQTHDIVMRFDAERMEYMTRCSGWPTYGKGWVLRICRLLRKGAQDV
ncbi:glycoside hydrolase family 108 protein [Undibacterium sp. SXout7W]|uniref:glycoside hydrolase family 108 protein n=1 Tax=Undibacterium sp. SXout7W TaxID=3413049 RepID=UPI003BF45398